MSKQLSLLALLLTISSFSFANNNELWDKGNLHYQQGGYDSAVFYYQQIEGTNTDIYYNLGNAYYKLNDIGNAILNYERALKVDNSNKLAYENLYLTHTRINNRIQPVQKIFFVRWWNNISSGQHTNTYAIISVILFLMLIVYSGAKRLKLYEINLPTQLFIAVSVLCFVFVSLSFASANNQITDTAAIVMEDNASLMKKPEYGNSTSLIPEGTKVQITNTQADWYEVQLPDGRIGWMQKDVITKI